MSDLNYVIPKDQLLTMTLQQAEARIEQHAEELAFLFSQLQAAGRINMRGYDVGRMIAANAIVTLRGTWKA